MAGFHYFVMYTLNVLLNPTNRAIFRISDETISPKSIDSEAPQFLKEKGFGVKISLFLWLHIAFAR